MWKKYQTHRSIILLMSFRMWLWRASWRVHARISNRVIVTRHNQCHSHPSKPKVQKIHCNNVVFVECVIFQTPDWMNSKVWIGERSKQPFCVREPDIDLISTCKWARTKESEMLYREHTGSYIVWSWTNIWNIRSSQVGSTEVRP